MAKRWGIAGYGWVARDFMAPAILEAGDRLVAVADPQAASRAQAAAHGIAPFESLEAMLAESGCDIVYVATPNHRHAEGVTQVARHGLPVLCEKPMAATLADAQSMAQAIGRSGVLYGTAFDQRHHPAHRAMQGLIAREEIGLPVALRIVYACWVGPHWSQGGATNWRADPRAAGGGAAIDLALHGLDLAQYLLGEPVVSLQIELQRRVHRYAVDDGAMLIGRTTSDVLVSLHVAYNCRETLPRRRLEVLGDAGLLVAVDTMGQTAGGHVALQRIGNIERTELVRDLADRQIAAAIEEVAFDKTLSPFTAQVRAFSQAVQGQSHDFSLARDIALMNLFDTAYQKALSCL